MANSGSASKKPCTVTTGSSGEIASQTNRTVKYLTAEGPGLMVAWANENNFGIGTVDYLESSGASYPIFGPCLAEFRFTAWKMVRRNSGLPTKTTSSDFTTTSDEMRKFSFNSPFLEHSSESPSEWQRVHRHAGRQPNLRSLGP
ncbi:MAG: hypothetical protein IPK76_19300 [Lewinellaceae bacterium]|nr:hypothetical protein [Lewinellaceae bacterium]